MGLKVVDPGIRGITRSGPCSAATDGREVWLPQGAANDVGAREVAEEELVEEAEVGAVPVRRA